MNENNIRTLLEDTTFERTIAPKDDPSIQVLVDLLKRKALNKATAININANPQIIAQLKALKRIRLTRNPHRAYLTDLGLLIADGELSLRKYDP